MSIFIFILIILHSIYTVIVDYRKKDLKIFTYIISWYAFIYAVVPIFIIIDRQNNMLGFYKYIIPETSFLLESLIILIGYLCLIIGYKSYHGKGLYMKTSIFSYGKLHSIALILLVLGVSSYLYYINSYGGLQYILNNINEIRIGEDDNKNYLGAFVRIFSSFATYSLILQFFLLYKGYYKRKKIKLLILYTTIIFVFFTSLIGGGRASLIILFIYIFLSSYYLKNRKIKWKYLILLIFISLFIVIFGKTFLFSMFSENTSISFAEVHKNQKSIGFLNLFIHEFNHQLLSISNFINNSFDYRYLKDYIIWLFKPMKIFYPSEIGYDAISYYNTYMILGSWKSVIPPGFIGLGYINGGVILVAFQSLISGYLLSILDNSFKRSDFVNNGILFFIYIFLFNHLWFALQNGDISLIIQGSLAFYVLILFLLISRKIRFYR